MKIMDDDLLVVMRALYWYNDKMQNKKMTADDFIELENIDFLRQTISDYIKQRGYLL